MTEYIQESLYLGRDNEILLDIKEVALHLLNARELMALYKYPSAFIQVRVIFNPKEKSGINDKDSLSSSGFFLITVNIKTSAAFKNVNKVKQIFLQVGMELYEDTDWKKRFGEDAYFTKLNQLDPEEIWQAIEEIVA